MMVYEYLENTSKYHNKTLIIVLICIVATSFVYFGITIWSKNEIIQPVSQSDIVKQEIADVLRRSQPASQQNIIDMRTELSNARPANPADIEAIADQLRKVSEF